MPTLTGPRLVEAIVKLVNGGRPIRRKLAPTGGLRLERAVPALIVQRSVPPDEGRAIDRLCSTSVAYLSGPAGPETEGRVDILADQLSEVFGAFLVVELWLGPRDAREVSVLVPDDPDAVPLVGELQRHLRGLRVAGQRYPLRIVTGCGCGPPGLEPLLDGGGRRRFVFGVAIPPAFVDGETGELYPLILRDMRRQLQRAVRHLTYAFLLRFTTQRPGNFQAVGSHTIPKAVWEVDRRLADVADDFDFLLLVTPINAGDAWKRFKASGYERVPRFLYRPVPTDPTLLKRRLYAAPVERVDDPALYQLFREKQDELDRQITLLLDKDTPRFVHGSLQLYGKADEVLLTVSREMLEALRPRKRGDDEEERDVLDCEAFARRVQEELDGFRRQWEGVDARVEIRDDVTGLLVSKGSVLMGRDASIPVERVEALVQHEVGTHVLTYYNGKAQPFRQLYSGLAGYDALQEGLAVLAEYLVGGMTNARRRLLAARVVAVDAMVSGASFIETFRQLHDTYGFAGRSAFMITMRVYRGGGLTKDSVYLRGVGELLDHLRNGGSHEALLMGKIAPCHVPLLEELRWREVLKPARLRPSYLDRPETARELERIRSGLTMFQLLEAKARGAVGAG